MKRGKNLAYLLHWTTFTFSHFSPPSVSISSIVMTILEEQDVRKKWDPLLLLPCSMHAHPEEFLWVTIISKQIEIYYSVLLFHISWGKGGKSWWNVPLSTFPPQPVLDSLPQLSLLFSPSARLTDVVMTPSVYIMKQLFKRMTKLYALTFPVNSLVMELATGQWQNL